VYLQQILEKYRSRKKIRITSNFEDPNTSQNNILQIEEEVEPRESGVNLKMVPCSRRKSRRNVIKETYEPTETMENIGSDLQAEVILPKKRVKTVTKRRTKMAESPQDQFSENFMDTISQRIDAYTNGLYGTQHETI
jgi:hypothetical protein